MSLDEQAEAILARLTAAGLRALETEPTGTTTAYPYVVAYFATPLLTADRVADVRAQMVLDWQTVAVGARADQCRQALDRLNAALGDWRPVITGRRFHKVTHEGSQPTRRDPSMPDRNLYIATDQWRVLSDPTV